MGKHPPMEMCPKAPTQGHALDSAIETNRDFDKESTEYGVYQNCEDVESFAPYLFHPKTEVFIVDKSHQKAVTWMKSMEILPPVLLKRLTLRIAKAVPPQQKH